MSETGVWTEPVCKRCRLFVKADDFIIGTSMCYACDESHCTTCREQLPDDAVGRQCFDCVDARRVKRQVQVDDVAIVLETDKVSGYVGGVMHYDVTEDDLARERRVDRNVENHHELMVLDGRNPISGGFMQFCDSCQMAVPVALTVCPDC